MKRKGLNKRAFLAAAAVLLAGITVPAKGIAVQAAEAHSKGEQQITLIYHMHTGDQGQQGGCFNTPVYHVHQGSESEGGVCYETPIYHTHSGEETVEGGCYHTAVLHEHQGDGTSQEGCYRAVYHSHGDSCYRRVSSSEYGCYIVNWHDTSDDDWTDGDGNFHDYKNYEMSCGQKIHGTNASHFHEVLSCNQGNVVTGYTLGCGKTEESVEKYLPDCGRTGEDIDSYALSCLRTAEDIDSYAMSCKKTEETAVGRIVLTRQWDGSHEREWVTADFEDLTQGEIRLSDTPFTWYDSQGNVLGSEETMVFSENGSYSVALGVLNEDVNQDSLRAGLKIDGIVKPVPDSGSGDSGKEDSENEDHESSGDSPEEEAGEQQGEVSPTPTLTPSPAPTVTPAGAADSGTADRGGGKQGAARKSGEKQASLPTIAPPVRRVTKTVTLEKKSSEKEEMPEMKSLPEIGTAQHKKGRLSAHTVGLITVTVGSLLAGLGLFAVLYLLRQSVRVYNDDGRGKMSYLGRCRVKLQEEGYAIEITEAMIEKSVTNRYCIRGDLFALFKAEEEELTVVKGHKRIALPISREMTAVI